MSDNIEIKKVQAEITRDQQRLEELKKGRPELIEHISDSGSTAMAQQVNILTEMEFLEYQIERNKELLLLQ